MNRKFYFILFYFIYISTAMAGNRGYSLFAWGNEAGREYIIDYANSDAYKTSKTCWGNRSGGSISDLYMKVYPTGITDELINSFLSGNKNAVAKIRKSLQDFSDDQISPSHGFDGMIIVKKEGNDVEIDTITLKGTRYLYKRKFVVKNNDDYRSFDKQLCEALAPIDGYFSP